MDKNLSRRSAGGDGEGARLAVQKIQVPECNFGKKGYYAALFLFIQCKLDCHPQVLVIKRFDDKTIRVGCFCAVQRRAV